MVEGGFVGAQVGTKVGWKVGAVVGTKVGWKVGAVVGNKVGWKVGAVVGTKVGWKVGAVVGTKVGWKVGFGQIVKLLFAIFSLSSICWSKQKYLVSSSQQFFGSLSQVGLLQMYPDSARFIKS